jgi:hypothetical protein
VGSYVCRLLFGPDVLLLGVGIWAHRILLTGLFRSGSVLLNRFIRTESVLFSVWLALGARLILDSGLVLDARFALNV